MTFTTTSVYSKPFSFLNISFSAATARQIFDFLGDGFPSKQLTSSQLPPEVHLNEYELKRFNDRFATIKAIDPQNTDELKTAMRTFLFNIFIRHFNSTEPVLEDMPPWLEQMCENLKKNGNLLDSQKKSFLELLKANVVLMKLLLLIQQILKQN